MAVFLNGLNRITARMNNQKKAVAFFFLSLLLTATISKAEPVGRWWSDWAMGTSEYGYSDGSGNKVLISCSDDTGTFIAAYFAGRSVRPGDKIVFSVDGDRVEFLGDSLGQVATSSRVDSTNFQYLWAKMRQGSRLQVFSAGRSASFPLTGSAKALEAQPCTTDYDR